MGEDSYVLFCLNVKKDKSLIILMSFGAVASVVFVASLILLPIFWTNIINSECISAWLKRMIMSEESEMTPDEKSQLWNDVKDTTTSVGLPAIIILIFLFLVLEVYFNYILYGLYNNFKEANNKPIKSGARDRGGTAVHTRNRKSELADSTEMKPTAYKN